MAVRGGLYTITTRDAGTVLTAGIYYDDHIIHVNNLYPAMIDDHSIDNSEATTVTDPYPSGSILKAASLGKEIEMIRYQLVQAAQGRGLNPTNWQEDITGMYAASSGTDTITATFTPPLLAHTSGLPLLIKAGGTNTGACTFNPNSLGAVSIKIGSSDPVSGQITSGKGYWLMYDGSVYQLLNPSIPSFRGALVYLSGDQTIATGAIRTVTWDSEVYDTDTIHDTSSNTSRLTVPSGVTKVILRANLVWSGSANSVEAAIYKNGADFEGAPSMCMYISAADRVYNFTSPTLSVTGGDYFEVKAGAQTNNETLKATLTQLYLEVKSWFSMEIVE